MERENDMDRAGNFLPRLDGDPYSGRGVDRNVVALTAPASAAAEQFRTLYFRLERLRRVRPAKVVAITSAVEGEGKTLTALNLALTAARATIDRRVLLVDADLRLGQVAELLGVPNTPGLKEVLEGGAEARDVVRRFQGERLAVVPSGGPAAEPTQLLASPRMHALLGRIREHFDEAYLDLPPTLPFADAAILGAMADGVLLVIRAGQTPAPQVYQAIEHLAGAPIVGCVLNGAQRPARQYGRRDAKSAKSASARRG
jgi:capsular exopolysaccharide synthesis family protein